MGDDRERSISPVHITSRGTETETNELSGVTHLISHIQCLEQTLAHKNTVNFSSRPDIRTQHSGYAPIVINSKDSCERPTVRPGEFGLWEQSNHEVSLFPRVRP